MFSIRLSCRDPHIHRLSLHLTQRTDTSPSLIVVKTFIQSNTLIVHEALGRFKKQKVVRITCNCLCSRRIICINDRKTEKLTKIKLINDKQKPSQLAHVCHQVSSVRPHYQLRRENQTLFIKDQKIKL